MQRTVLFSGVVLGLLLLTVAHAQKDAAQPFVLNQKITTAKDGPMAKVGALAQLYAEYTALPKSNRATFRGLYGIHVYHVPGISLDSVQTPMPALHAVFTEKPCNLHVSLDRIR